MADKKILISYLSECSLQIRWQNEKSRKMPLNSGAGQGTMLGLFFFVIIFNGARPKPATIMLGEALTQTGKKRKPLQKGKKRWVDDCPLTFPVRLSDSLIPDTRPTTIGPSNFHDRTGQILPQELNLMQSELDLFNEYCRQSKLKIYQEKASTCFLTGQKKTICLMNSI